MDLQLLVGIILFNSDNTSVNYLATLMITFLYLLRCCNMYISIVVQVIVPLLFCQSSWQLIKHSTPAFLSALLVSDW
jgi:hypothetical protein